MAIKRESTSINQIKDKIDDRMANGMSVILEEHKKAEEVPNNESSSKISVKDKEQESIEIKKRPVSDVNTPFNTNIILKEISKEDEDVLRFVLLHCDQNVKAFSQNDFIKASIIEQEGFLKESTHNVSQKHIYL
jgi:hypothetical protein